MINNEVRDEKLPGMTDITPSILYFGTPAVIISSLNPDGSTNISPMSSAWALGYTIPLGLANTGQTIANLRRVCECVLNFPTADLWESVEALGHTTGRNPVPESRHKRGIRFVADKFAHTGFTAEESRIVRPYAVAECPLRMEATVRDIAPLGDDNASIVQVHIERVIAYNDLIIDGRHIDPNAWHPLIYNFRHYFGLGPELGAASHSETRERSRAKLRRFYGDRDQSRTDRD